MGRVTTPKYKLEIRTQGSNSSVQAWRGRPSAERLDEYLKGYAASLLPGGVNAHVTERVGLWAATIWYAAVVRNDGSEVIEIEWYAPTKTTVSGLKLYRTYNGAGKVVYVSVPDDGRNQQHAGAVCEECGRTITEAEYSGGVTRCCTGNVISEEEAIQNGR